MFQFEPIKFVRMNHYLASSLFLFSLVSKSFDENKYLFFIFRILMNTGAKWAIILGVGIPSFLILIGLFGLLIKFFMKRCRKKPWENITTEPKSADIIENTKNFRNFLRRDKSSERQPIYPSSTNNALEESNNHISIPMNENENTIDEHEHKQTLVQIQRERLNRLKEDEKRSRPMIHLAYDENEIQRTIDQVQKEFEESVGLI